MLRSPIAVQPKQRVLTVKSMWMYSREFHSWGKVLKVGVSPYIAGTRRAADADPFTGQGKAYYVVSENPHHCWSDWIEAGECQ